MEKANESRPRRTFNDWYEENKDELSTKRSQRYRDDPTHRTDAIARARDYRERRKQGTAVERQHFRPINGVQTEVYSTGAAADIIGTYNQMIINWEKRKWIPRPIFEGDLRLYTAHQVALLKELLDAFMVGTRANRSEIVEPVVAYIHDNWE